MTAEEEYATLRRKLDDIYTPIDEVKAEIWKRWNDPELKKRVAEFLGDDIPEILKETPSIALSRHLFSPNFELRHFLDLAKKAELKPIGLEYLQDKLVSINVDKYYLTKMIFDGGIGKRGGRKTTSLKVVDFDFYDGKKISEVQTVTGGSFIDFHHALTGPVMRLSDIVDMSGYYLRNGKTASKYYTYILSLFVCYGVLCECYLLNDEYRKLTEEILLPCFQVIKDRFGLKPLIVRLAPPLREEDLDWRYYPETVREDACSIIDLIN